MKPNIDLVKEICPSGYTVEIEGKGECALDICGVTFLAGIARARSFLTGKIAIIGVNIFPEDITIMSVDEDAKKMKVRIAEH